MPVPGSATPPAIHVEGVGKIYRTWASPAQRLIVPLMLRLAGALDRLLPAVSARLRAASRTRMHVHEALRDVSFQLQPGEALGVIGLNGSGKSTLLQIIAGVLPPTSGRVRTHGRVAALLELGSGFNPELTGRENIYINAAILGMDRAQTELQLPRIIDFADIGDYIDQPVKTYSSGMALRLAFSVQVHIDPDILIVDEALAVGDAAFQAKAMARIDQILARGTTLLFVGHDLNAVKAFCHRAMLLERGRIVMQGLPDEVITEYLYRTHQRTLDARQQDSQPLALQRLDDGYGVDDACVVECSLNGTQHATLAHGQRVEIRLRVRLRPDLLHPVIILDVMDGKGLQLTGRRIALTPVAVTTEVPLSVAFDACFQQGIYGIRTRVVEAPSLDQTTALSRQQGILSFEIVDDSRALFTGLFPVPMDIRVDG